MSLRCLLACVQGNKVKTIATYTYKKDPCDPSKQLVIYAPVRMDNVQLKGPRFQSELIQYWIAALKAHSNNCFSAETMAALESNVGNIMIYNTCKTSSQEHGCCVPKNQPLDIGEDGAWTVMLYLFDWLTPDLRARLCVLFRRPASTSLPRKTAIAPARCS